MAPALLESRASEIEETNMFGPIRNTTVATSLIGVGALLMALAMFADVLWR